MADELTGHVLEELNVRDLAVLDDESEMVERTLYPLLPVIGPRHGAAVGAVMAGARAGDWRLSDDGRVDVGGVTLEADEFLLTARARPGHEVAEDGDLLVALDTALTPELESEGMAREVAHRLQGLRKAAGYEISDRIVAAVAGEPDAVARLAPHRAWLATEVLATDLQIGGEAGPADPDRSETIDLDGSALRLSVRRA